MKNTIILTFTIFISINSLSQYNIELKIKGAENMKAQFAYYQSDNQFVVQSGKFDDKGKLTFKGDKTLQHGVYFMVVGQDFFDVLIRDNQNFKLRGDTSDLVFSMKVVDSEENRIFFNYQRDVLTIKGKIESLEKKLQENEEDSALSAKYGAEIQEQRLQLDKVGEKIKKDYPHSYIVKIINAIDSNLDDFDFADKELLLTPFYYNKIRLFIKKNVEQKHTYINSEIRKLLESVRHEQNNYRYVLTYLLNFYSSFYKTGMNKVFVFIADNYFLPDKAEWLTKEQLQGVKDRRDFLAQSMPGQSAQDLVMESITGEYFSLLQVKAKYTFLYFWSADCGHCTKTTQLLKDNYEKLQKNGIEVFAVNIDKDKDKWIRKVNDLQTNWINCCDVNEDTEYRDKYYVFSSPLLYLINSEKKIEEEADGETEITNLVKKMAE